MLSSSRLTIKSALSSETLLSIPKQSLDDLLKLGTLHQHDLVITYDRYKKIEEIANNMNFRIGKFISRHLFECHLLMLGTTNDDERRILANAKIKFIIATINKLEINLENSGSNKLERALTFTLINQFNPEKIISQLSKLIALESYLNKTHPYVITEHKLVLFLPRYQKSFIFLNDKEKNNLFKTIETELPKRRQALYSQPAMMSYHTNTHIDVSIFSLTSMLSIINYGIIVYFSHESGTSLLIPLLPIIKDIFIHAIKRAPNQSFANELIEKHNYQNRKKLTVKDILLSPKAYFDEDLCGNLYSNIMKYDERYHEYNSIKSMLKNDLVNNHSRNFIILYHSFLIIWMYILISFINTIRNYFSDSTSEQNLAHSTNIIFFALHFLLLPQIARVTLNFFSVDTNLILALSAEMDHILKQLDLSSMPDSRSNQANNNSNSNNTENITYAPLYVLEESIKGSGKYSKPAGGKNNTQAADQQKISPTNTNSSLNTSTFILDEERAAVITKDQSKIYITWDDPNDKSKNEILNNVKNGMYSLVAHKGVNGFVHVTYEKKDCYKLKLFDSNNSNPRWLFEHKDEITLKDNLGHMHKMPHYHCNTNGFINKNEQTKKLKRH